MMVRHVDDREGRLTVASKLGNCLVGATAGVKRLVPVGESAYASKRALVI